MEEIEDKICEVEPLANFLFLQSFPQFFISPWVVALCAISLSHQSVGQLVENSDPGILNKNLTNEEEIKKNHNVSD